MKILCVLATCCLSLAAFSQKSDYLVKNNGDTIRGKIKLTDKIFYVSGATVAEIGADEVSTVKSGRYNGTVVHCKLELYTDNISDLEIDYIRRGSVDTVMVLEEIYSSPKINLYFGISDFRTQYYFYKTPNDDKPVQLVIRYFLQGGLANYTDDRARYGGERSRVNIVEDKGYVNQLRAIMGDCNKISDITWELLTYRNYSIKNVMKRYNKCR